MEKSRLWMSSINTGNLSLQSAGLMCSEARWLNGSSLRVSSPFNSVWFFHQCAPQMIYRSPVHTGTKLNSVLTNFPSTLKLQNSKKKKEKRLPLFLVQWLWSENETEHSATIWWGGGRITLVKLGLLLSLLSAGEALLGFCEELLCVAASLSHSSCVHIVWNNPKKWSHRSRPPDKIFMFNGGKHKVTVKGRDRTKHIHSSSSVWTASLSLPQKAHFCVEDVAPGYQIQSCIGHIDTLRLAAIQQDPSRPE